MKELLELPNDEKAERGILGAILLEPDASFSKINLSKDDFYKVQHQYLFQALKDMYVDNIGLDAITVTNYLNDNNLLKKVGGEEYLLELMDSTIVACHTQHYQKIVKEKSNLRFEIKVFQEGIRSAMDGEQSTDKVISTLSISNDYHNSASLNEMAKKFVEDSNSGACGKFPWWCESWDKKLGMVDRGSTAPLMLLVSPRSTGKTALSLNWLKRLHNHGLKIAYSSIEMQTAELVPRLIASYGINTWNMSTRGYCTKDELQKSEVAIKDIKRLDLIIKDKSQSIDDIRSFCISQSRKGQLDGLIVDNLLTINPGTKDYVNRTIFYDYCISRFKELRDELNIPILILCHPTGDKVAYSQNCENIADVILFLHNVGRGIDVNGVTIQPDYDIMGTDCVIKFSKNRQGLSPVARCSFHKDYQNFEHIRWEDGID